MELQLFPSSCCNLITEIEPNIDYPVINKEFAQKPPTLVAIAMLVKATIPVFLFPTIVAFYVQSFVCVPSLSSRLLLRISPNTFAFIPIPPMSLSSRNRNELNFQSNSARLNKSKIKDLSSQAFLKRRIKSANAFLSFEQTQNMLPSESKHIFS